VISESPNERTHQVFAAVYDTTGEIATNQTGSFPTTSSRGHKYVLILYDYDSNAILAATIALTPNTASVQQLAPVLVERGFRPQLQKLDNEASKALKRSTREK
jgi:hypothetical protein